MTTEKDPNGKSPHEAGAKLDAGKTMAGLLASFGQALLAVGDVSTYGAKKYTRDGWEIVPEGINRYTDAMWRHLLKEHLELRDPESKLLHAAHTAWNALARLELMIRQEPKMEARPARNGEGVLAK